MKQELELCEICGKELTSDEEDYYCDCGKHHCAGCMGEKACVECEATCMGRFRFSLLKGDEMGNGPESCFLEIFDTSKCRIIALIDVTTYSNKSPANRR